MYLPPHFEEQNEKEIINLIEQFPLAALVCYSDGEFVVNHIPLLRDCDGVYIGHIAKANPLSTLFPNGTNAIAIFNGEDSYISPNWYPTKAQDHRQVPTWNYQVVHLHGQIEFESSKKNRIAVVGKLTKKYEKLTSGSEEWKMSDAPKEYLEQMLENIVAFKFIVKKITAKSKLSQNRGEKDFKAVMSAMDKIGKPVLASAMQRTNKVGT
ncbi:MAG: FMN-binding negative transcriptional regulator [Nisaea sp.]|nr:FMN-binding negative transcriptional regulator [Nisaea sp.]